MAAIGTLVDGAFTGTYNAVGIGFTEKGYELIMSLKEEVVDESDQYGGSIIEFFYRGGNCQIRCDAKEWRAGAINAMWPWGALGLMRGATSLEIGVRASAIAKQLVLTAQSNTPAAAVGITPQTLTAAMAIAAPGQSSTIMFSTTLRKVPIFMQLLPDDVSGVTRWFTTT